MAFSHNLLWWPQAAHNCIYLNSMYSDLPSVTNRAVLDALTVREDRQPAQVDVQPAPAGLAIQLHALEDRILTRTDEIVGGFNQVLQVGLGEVQAKYKVGSNCSNSGKELQVREEVMMG